jgi:sugar lactone lactonase YvrE
MKNVHPDCLWQIGAELGEGPVWHQGTDSVYFVDIKGRKIHRYSTVTEEALLAGRWATWFHRSTTTDEHFICGIQDALYRFNPADGACQRMVEVKPRRQGNRINDGFVDRPACFGSARWMTVKLCRPVRSTE